MKRLALVVVGLLFVGGVVWAGYNAPPQTWDTTYENDPDNTDAISVADDHFRAQKQEIRRRAEVEHAWGSGFAKSQATETARHLEGSARAFWNATAPAALEETDIAASGTLDEGRLWRDSDVDNGILQIYDGSGWVDAVTAMQGDPNNQIDLLGGAQFKKAGSDPMDLHAHAGERHQLTGSDGAWVDALDGLPLTIVGVTEDNTCANAAVTDTYPAFGVNQQALVELDFTGRTGNSRVFVVAYMEGSTSSGLIQLQYRVVLDDVSTVVLRENRMAYHNSVGSVGGTTGFGYYATVDASDHDFVLQVEDTAGSVNAVTDCRLMIIDLGNS